MMLWLLLACGSAEDSGDPACTAPEAVTWESYGHIFMTTYCVSCHSVYNEDHRFGAPVGVDFDTEADLLRQVERVRVRVLEEQTMPVAGGVFPEDLLLLERYLGCLEE
jgi:uncharacterized membrane protein